MIKLLMLLLLALPLQATPLPKALAVPGGIVEIELGSTHQSKPRVFFQQHRVLITAHDDRWLAVVGLPLSLKPGKHTLTVFTADNTSADIAFTVHDKAYPEQRLTITKKRMVTGFTKADLKKIAADKVEMTKAKSVWSETPAKLDFITPVDGRLSSLFGLKRFFNDIPKRPHNGLDIAAPTGTPVLAPTDATVINTGHYYFNGNTIFLDHGQGLLSAYLHLNHIQVKAGDQVKQGQQIGTVGDTGRVTGPHLHWIVYLNKSPVDPALFIARDIPRLAARNKH
ncbi:peptidoglycan DD-metalloendopeptidase family protein [methane-oxidizing endosymbiont of Gigantopelta aegis]|uniref:peptidoglycan DD-metalloendopeptidase family protein n=1 Tax=methane-oxidizing endosymbiont of Gigantopelta aegis TaxID=2794938 RepID=UPI0018DEA545|nr:peptidoglycan DD-metalloendopeptidase family protein [methane-oxidizing endosymbiont of Gigantopelta aegis]